jgi:hypothetical protein
MSQNRKNGLMPIQDFTDEEAQRRFEAALRGAREVGHETMKNIPPKRIKAAMKSGKRKAKTAEKASPPGGLT